MLPPRPYLLNVFVVLTGVLAAAGTGARAAQPGELSVGTAGYAQPLSTDFLERKTGEVTIPVHLSLLGGGAFTGIGALTEKHLLDNRLSVSIGETPALDSDMIGNAANPFAAGESRRAINIDGAVWDAGKTTLSVGGTLLQSTVTAIDENTALPAGEETYRVVGSGARMGLFGGRVRGAAEFAWSLKETLANDGEEAAPSASDSAHRIAIDADLVKQDNRAVSVFAFHRRIAPDFRTTMGDAPADRDELGAGGNIKVGRVAVNLGFSSFRNNLDREPSVLTMREDTAWVGLIVDLAQPGRGRLLPSAIELTGHTTDRQGLPDQSTGAVAADAITGEHVVGHGLAVHWGVPGDRVSLAWFANAREALHADTNADATRKATLNLSRTVETAGWRTNITAYLGEIGGHEGGDRFRTRKTGVSVAFSTIGPDARRFNVFANVDQRRIWDPNAADLKIKTTWELRTGAELLRLAPRGAMTGPPALSAYLAARGNAPDEGQSGIRRVDLTAGLAGKIQF